VSISPTCSCVYDPTAQGETIEASHASAARAFKRHKRKETNMDISKGRVTIGMGRCKDAVPTDST
jgi:hypothetical protein